MWRVDSLEKTLMLGGIGGRRKGDDRGWDGWMASLTQWTWVWVNSGSWWWTGRPGVLRFMGSQRLGHDWVTELNWSSSHQVVKLLELQHQYFQWTFRTDLLQDWLGWSCNPRDSQVSLPTPQFKSILWCSAFFILQLSYPYVTTGKTIAFTI